MSTFLSTTELERMTPQELGKELQLKRAECAKMRIGLTMQSEKNSALYRTHRRDIARMTMVYKKMQKNPAAVMPKKEKSVTAAKSPVSAPKASQKAKKPVKGSSSASKKS